MTWSCLKVSLFYCRHRYSQSHLSCPNSLLKSLCISQTFNYIWWAAIKIQFPFVSAGPFLLHCSRKPHAACRLQAFTRQSSMDSKSSQFCVFLTALLFLSSHPVSSLHPFYSASPHSHSLLYQISSSVCFCTSLSLAPFFAPVFCFRLAQEQIRFITFLMLFVIAWRSQHVKSKSCFRAVVCVWCAGISISPLRVLHWTGFFHPRWL